MVVFFFFITAKTFKPKTVRRKRVTKQYDKKRDRKYYAEVKTFATPRYVDTHFTFVAGHSPV